MNPTPLVSISCITYNHAPYIRECLDGFMMQQTNFPFEVLIHDDASTDGTTEIIQEYAEKYPDIIKPLYEEENQWVKGRRGSAVFNFPRAQGKYIALCEGDDCWTDPLKLQKQVDFLEANPDFVMCSHVYDSFYQVTRERKYSINKDCAGKIYSLENIVNGDWALQTATIMFKWDVLNIEHYSKYRIKTDTVLVYELLKQGLGYIMDAPMSLYRIHDFGVWSGIDNVKQWERCVDMLLSIHEIENSAVSAKLVRTSLFYGIGRRDYLINIKLTIKILLIVGEYYGWKYLIKWVCKKFILGKDLG